MLAVGRMSCPAMTQRAPQLLDHFLAITAASSGCVQIRQQDRELISAQPRQRVAAAQTTLQASGDTLEQFVAFGMAQRVVDSLKRSRSINSTAASRRFRRA